MIKIIATDEYIATREVPCPACDSATIPATPGRIEEQGWYCEKCGTARDENGRILL